MDSHILDNISGTGNNSCTFTIFIPTYNRANLLLRAFKSIEEQSYENFEVIIIDDGSTDETEPVVRDWQSRMGFPVRYIRQENRGKPSAHNAAVDLARGFFVVILDSDDILAPRALEIFKIHWDSIPEEQRSCYAGVEGLCAYLDNRQIAGQKFPEDVFDSNYLEIHYRYRVHGDKKNAVRTDVLKKFPFPIFEGEKHVRESVVWCRIAHSYRFRYINEVVQYIEYQAGGLSDSVYQRRISNPRGFRLAHMEMVNEHSEYCSLTERLKDAAKYIRFSLHSGIGIFRQAEDINHKLLWMLALPKGITDWLRDQVRMRISG